MREYYPVIKRSPLFAGVDDEAIAHILCCMEAHTKTYGRGEILFHSGDIVVWAGIVLEGRVALTVPDAAGEESALRTLEASEAFGCAHSCVAGQPSLFTVTARKRTKILFLKLSKLFCPAAIRCHYASLLTANLLRQTAVENLEQVRRIHMMSRRTIREKLLMYLRQEGLLPGGGREALGMNRQELADYLGVERSALSREMARMQQEGLIAYHRNEIELRRALAQELWGVCG